MKTFCVPSHKLIDINPLDHQGVVLITDMLKNGIWFNAGGSTDENENRYLKEIELRRSENEPEFQAALRALLKVHNDERHIFAVISIRWCSLTYRLVTARRVWLSIYAGRRTLRTFSHTNQGDQIHALANFLDSWDDLELDQAVWETRFAEIVKPAKSW
jgi:hypothetical protein